MTADEARQIINNFQYNHSSFKGMDHVRFADGEMIYFGNMTDDEAIRVANGLIDIEAEASIGAVKQ